MHNRPMAAWTISGPAVRAEVQPLGAMLGPAFFRVGGRTVQPFAVAPWADDPPTQLDTLPPLLRRLRGEWPCVPFGMPEPRRDLPPDWLAGAGDGVVIDPEPHGTAAGRPWSLLHQGNSALRLAIDLPAPHPISRLERHVSADPQHPMLHMTLSVVPRADTLLPFGVHPVFALPTEVGAVQLVFAPSARVWTFPTELEPGVSRVRPDQRDVQPHSIRLSDGGTVDVTRLPLPFATEELLLVTGAAGQVELVDHRAGTRMTLRWDSAVFPCCALWLSNRGRTTYPWSGRFLAVGIEPVCAPFDLGILHAQNGASPLALAGIVCAHQFRAGIRFDTRYSIGLVSA
jgi:hypothetical protein